jgi:hypothetical protein
MPLLVLHVGVLHPASTIVLAAYLASLTLQHHITHPAFLLFFCLQMRTRMARSCSQREDRTEQSAGRYGMEGR